MEKEIVELICFTIGGVAFLIFTAYCIYLLTKEY